MTAPVRILPGDVLDRRPNGTFLPGTHWRPRKAYWDRDWLLREYVERQRSSSEIAADTGCTENNIHFWLRKHGIPRRSVSQARSIKHWGATGAANPMYGRIGPLSASYVDGSSPERQRMYVRGEGKAFLRLILERDGYKCVRCDAGHTGPRSLHVHHKRPWAGNREVRFDPNNAVTLCRTCHGWVHSRLNLEKEYLE